MLTIIVYWNNRAIVNNKNKKIVVNLYIYQIYLFLFVKSIELKYVSNLFN